MTNSDRAKFIPLDQRDPSTVRAVILARLSDETGADSAIESQIAACDAFRARQDWTLAYPPFAEKKSGFRNVKRAALAEVEALIAQRAVDVVIVNDWERLARTEEWRYYALYHARRYGVEYRFASLGADGRLDETPMAKLYGSVMQVFGEIERDKIYARTMRGRMRRAERGVPTGGRGGAPFGYCFVGEPPYQAWERNDAEADLLLWMCETLLADPAASARSLARTLKARGIKTREGYDWTSATISTMLRNPIYCGKGRLLRWQTEWKQVSDDASGEVFDMRGRGRRAADETLPIAEGAVPVLIPPALFDAVQAKLDHNRTFPAGPAPRDPLPDGFTLLHGGLVVCARCGLPMARHRRELAGGVVGYYMCSARLRSNEIACPVHSINAPVVDDLVLRVVAMALADPERMVALANAASERLEQAQTRLAVVESRLDAARERLRDLDAERARVEKILALLNTTTDGPMIVEYRSRLTAFDAERDTLRARADEMTPQMARAEAGVALLASLHEGRLLARVEHDGRAFDLTCVTRSDLLAMTGAQPEQITAIKDVLGAEIAAEGDDIDAMAFDEWFSAEPMEQADIAYLLLSVFMAPAERRRLLRTLEVKVSVSPPWPKEERAARGMTPYWARVRVEMGDLILWDGDEVQARLGVEVTHDRLRQAHHSETEANVKVRMLMAISMPTATGSPPLGTR
jgi:DNA invertase Pin-like site-specific DNA recombinase